jgi:cytochrome c oxidase subunit 4
VSTATTDPHAVAHHEAHVPSDGQYILIALGLAALTAIEVAIYYLKSSNAVLVAFFVLMITKFAIVVGYFMHLRFDKPVVRRLFIGGLCLAGGVYTIFFFMFGVFHF